MTSLAACLAIALAIQLSRPPQERIVVREVHLGVPTTPVVADARPVRDVRSNPIAKTIAGGMAPSVSLALPASSVLQMRNTALRFGIDAIPHAPAAGSTKPAGPSAWGHPHELRQVETESKSSM